MVHTPDMALTWDSDQPMTISVVLNIDGPPTADLAEQLRDVWELAPPEDTESDGGILIGEGEAELAGVGCVIRIENLSDGVKGVLQTIGLELEKTLAAVIGGNKG